MKKWMPTDAGCYRLHCGTLLSFAPGFWRQDSVSLFLDNTGGPDCSVILATLRLEGKANACHRHDEDDDKHFFHELSGLT
jgi:hypothetical protein